MAEGSRDEFREHVGARFRALLRPAYLLTGSRGDAEDLLQTTLATTYLAWGRVREREARDGCVRRVVVNTRTSFWRRRRVDERPTDDLPERSSGGTRRPTSTCTTRCGRPRAAAQAAARGRGRRCARTPLRADPRPGVGAA